MDSYQKSAMKRKKFRCSKGTNIGVTNNVYLKATCIGLPIFLILLSLCKLFSTLCIT